MLIDGCVGMQQERVKQHFDSCRKRRYRAKYRSGIGLLVSDIKWEAVSFTKFFNCIIIWFSVRYTSTGRDTFNVNALTGKLHQLASPNLEGIFIGR